MSRMNVRGYARCADCNEIFFEGVSGEQGRCDACLQEQQQMQEQERSDNGRDRDQGVRR